MPINVQTAGGERSENEKGERAEREAKTGVEFGRGTEGLVRGRVGFVEVVDAYDLGFSEERTAAGVSNGEETYGVLTVVVVTAPDVADEEAEAKEGDEST